VATQRHHCNRSSATRITIGTARSCRQRKFGMPLLTSAWNLSWHPPRLVTCCGKNAVQFNFDCTPDRSRRRSQTSAPPLRRFPVETSDWLTRRFQPAIIVAKRACAGLARSSPNQPHHIWPLCATALTPSAAKWGIILGRAFVASSLRRNVWVFHAL
jgi:hypothetical protein